MTVSEKDKYEMAAILAAMNRAEGKTVQSDILAAPPAGVKPAVTSAKPDVVAMKSILEKFNGVVGAARETLIEEAQTSQVAKEALITAPISNGARIGQYEIRVNVCEDVKGEKKLYDVYSKSGNHLIAKDLMLYEAAYALVKALNKGKLINDPTVKRILQLEEHFYTHRSDAARFRKRHAVAAQNRDHINMDIYEAKYQNARNNALGVRHELKKILETL
jgi:hypothetical protein